MRKLGWLLGLASAWGVAAGCSGRTASLDDAQSGGRTRGGTSAGGSGDGGATVSGQGGTASAAGSHAGGDESDAGAGQGAGGDGGEGAGRPGATCNDKQGPLLTFPECAEPTFATTGFTSGSSCSLTDTRRKMACGEPGSNLDADCCLRARCRNDSDCGAKAVCISRLVQTPEPGGSQFEECFMDCGECICFGFANFDYDGYCVGPDEELARFNCNTEGLSCATLQDWHTMLSEAELVSPHERTATGITSYAAGAIFCEDALDQALIERCGAPPRCDCSGIDCTVPLGDFHPLAAELGDARTGYVLKAIRETCPPPEAGYGHYSECDDGTVRYEIVQGSENLYRLVFPRDSDQLSYGHADGYVGELCAMAGELVNIDTGPAPAATSCRTCAFCASDWDSQVAGGGPPNCVFDQAGKISLPPLQ